MYPRDWDTPGIHKTRKVARRDTGDTRDTRDTMYPEHGIRRDTPYGIRGNTMIGRRILYSEDTYKDTTRVSGVSYTLILSAQCTAETGLLHHMNRSCP